MAQRKKVLVTGAASGIGAATARRFAAEGWDVCLTDRRSPVEDVKQGLPEEAHLAFVGDYTDAEFAGSMERDVRRNWGRLDVLVNCAGLYHEVDAIDAPLAEWRQDLDIMVCGAIHMTRLAAPLMDQGGRMIHITSIMARLVARDYSSYCMAKAALEQYCRSLALELADRGILVNAIAPGFVNTPMSIVNGVNELETERFRTTYVDSGRIPLRRPARPEEIASAAHFLAGPDASYITGTVLTVDGGLTITL